MTGLIAIPVRCISRMVPLDSALLPIWNRFGNTPEEGEGAGFAQMAEALLQLLGSFRIIQAIKRA
jgi:hypothetical protein